jgi:type VI secretion system secreted protein Hcp
MLIRALSLFLLLLSGLAAQAVMDIFMRIEGIPGESRDARHPNEIVLNNYSFNFAQAGNVAATGGGVGAGRTTVSPFTVTKYTDSSSPRLALASLTGEHLRQVTIAVRRQGRDPFDFLRYTLNDVVVTGFTQTESSTGTQPEETIQLGFGSIEMEYIPQRPDGSAGEPVKMGWDVRRNAPR